MSQELAIKIEDVHKRYRLGTIGSGLFVDEFKALLARMSGKVDPRLTLAQEEGLQRQGMDFWSLRGISFEVKKGEILGVIGHNGAGKSTLLKLLSRITLPTKGTIRMSGKISSLLEVGTGFHPELTGRENIFLNGSIMGMRRLEINARLEQIIEFSGIEHHIDTPIKRYSSGMKVRLGFAVAAHLEPDILILDEVLAVGDSEFQKKCLGKMHEVSTQEGRTVIFVSHNLPAVQNLCTRCIWLEQGRMRMEGDTETVVSTYAADTSNNVHEFTWNETEAPGNSELKVLGMRVSSMRADGVFKITDPIKLEYDILNLGITDNDLSVRVSFRTQSDDWAFTSDMQEAMDGAMAIPKGRSTFSCVVPADLLNAGGYNARTIFTRKAQHWITLTETMTFEMHEDQRNGAWINRWGGAVRPRLDWY